MGIGFFEKRMYICTRFERSFDLVAQLVEQYTFNVWALGSNPSQVTKALVVKLVDMPS